MSAIQPTTFDRSLTSETMNAEQRLCAKVLDAVIVLNVFDANLLTDIDGFASNHLLKWCVEILTLHQFGFFKGGDDWRDTLVRTLKYRLETLFSIGRCLNYEINFICAMDYADFFHTNANLSMDMQLENLLGENDGMFTKMEVYRKAFEFTIFY